MTTPPIQSDDFKDHLFNLTKQHAEKWGWVGRPGYSGPMNTGAWSPSELNMFVLGLGTTLAENEND
jgi:hypothetical protein